MSARWLLVVLLTFVMAIATISGTAWAQIMDPENSSGTLTDGTMDLILATSGSGPSGKVSVTNDSLITYNYYVVFSNVTPGNTGYQEWVLHDNGTIPGTLTINSTVTCTANPSPNELQLAVSSPAHDATYGDLGPYLGVKLQMGAGTSQVAAEGALSTYVYGSSSYYAPLSGLQAAFNGQIQSMSATGGESNYIVYKLSWSLPTTLKEAVGGYFTGAGATVGRQIVEGDSAAMNITFRLDQ